MVAASVAGAGVGAAAVMAWFADQPLVTRFPGITDGLLGCVGSTPLIELKSLSRATGCRILVRAGVDANVGG